MLEYVLLAKLLELVAKLLKLDWENAEPQLMLEYALVLMLLKLDWENAEPQLTLL